MPKCERVLYVRIFFTQTRRFTGPGKRGLTLLSIIVRYEPSSDTLNHCLTPHNCITQHEPSSDNMNHRLAEASTSCAGIIVRSRHF